MQDIDIILKNVPQNDSTGLVVSVNDMKEFLRLSETSAGETALLESAIRAATASIESGIQHALLTQTYKLYLDRFPKNYVRLPIQNITAIDSVVYQDEDDAEQTLSTSIYRLDSKGPLNKFKRKPNAEFPVVYTEDIDVVTITYTAGFGTASQVPDAIRHSIKIFAAHLFEQRESLAFGISVATLPDMVRVLLSPYFPVNV